MSNAYTNPFMQVDFTKMADWSKWMGEFKPMAMPMNMDAIATMQRRNIEAFTALNQVAFESMQGLMRRQADIARQMIEEMQGMMTAIMSASSPETKMARQAEASKIAMEKCMTNARDIAETFSKCNVQTMEMVNNRLRESLTELRGMMDSRQQAA